MCALLFKIYSRDMFLEESDRDMAIHVDDSTLCTYYAELSITEINYKIIQLSCSSRLK